MEKNAKISLWFLVFLPLLIQCYSSAHYMRPSDDPDDRRGDSGVELVKFMDLRNHFCEIRIYQEEDKYNKINEYLELSFIEYPGFIKERLGLRLSREFYGFRRELKIKIISDETLNSKIIGRYGLLLPVDGLYDYRTKTVYVNADDDLDTIIHEFFHFLRDISGIAMDRDAEERLADSFAKHVLDMEKGMVKAKIKNY